MRHSLNEIEVTLRKASIGAGFPVGLAQDIGAAAGWLAACSMNGAAAGLAAIENGVQTSPGQIADDGTVSFDDAKVGFAGPSAMDILASGASVHLGAPDAPLLLIGMAGVAARAYGLDITLEFGASAPLVVGPNGCQRGIPDALFGDVSLAARPTDSNAESSTKSTAGIEVDADLWNKINALAGKTYVPESEASRLQGAGAGLTDND